MMDDWVSGQRGAQWSREVFTIDLNSVRADNCVVSLVGFAGVQRVPVGGEVAVVVDEDGKVYDAVVESVLPDSRVYLRVDWASKRASTPTPVASYGSPSFTITPDAAAQ